MKKKGIGIDYSNICKNYNTVYLDRDNKDPQTQQCMKKVVAWLSELLSDIVDMFEFNLYHLTSDGKVKVDDIASNRFLFYSLEKEITLQSFVLREMFQSYNNITEWSKDEKESLLIQNDEEGEGVYLYCNEDSKLHKYLLEKLDGFVLDEVSI